MSWFVLIVGVVIVFIGLLGFEDRRALNHRITNLVVVGIGAVLMIVALALRAS